MASSFPGSIDNFTDPLSNSALSSPSHSGQHSDLNDAVEKIETYMGLVKVDSTTFANSANPFINGCFTSLYDHYRILVSVATSINNTDVRLRVRSGTNTTQSGTIYDRFGFTFGTSIANSTSTGLTSAILLTGYSGNDVSNAVIDFFNPNKTTYKNMMIQGWNANSGQLYFFNNRLSSLTQMTGLELIADAGTMTGTIRVYGYRN